jgi:hypothetical protein
MRLKIHTAAANDELVVLINEGYDAIATARGRYTERKSAGTFDDSKHVGEVVEPINTWADRVVAALDRIFPTKLETNLFSDPESQFGTVSGDYQYQSAIKRSLDFLRGLNRIRTRSLPEYTDLPLDFRLYVEDIESFQKVRDVNPATVLYALKNGYLDRPEDAIQTALERILSVPMHKKDWGGEQNDLYTGNVMIAGARRETAFLLKGNGLKKTTMEIRDCGRNGDQLLRLFNSPARLFIVQFVGNISESVVADIDGKVRQARTAGREAWYCIIDGQDTARVLKAYGEL